MSIEEVNNGVYYFHLVVVQSRETSTSISFLQILPKSLATIIIKVP